VKISEVKFYLRDRNPELANAWTSCFRDVKQVEASCGDIFDLQADAVVSPANSFGFMDGGIDLVYSNYFGWDLQDRLQAILQKEHDGELPVGQAVIVETLHERIPFLISAPTMRIPMFVANTVNAYLAFRATIRSVAEYNKRNKSPIKTVLCCGLGTATGGISPGVCAKQMFTAYSICVKGNLKRSVELLEAVAEHGRLTRVGD
jgi:Predicted phosphatase homologous to the C-terminal domain of histone macroH2A1